VKLLDGRDFTGKIDLFIGGSPCQSFSVGSHERLGFNDTRGTLFFEFCRLVNEIQPKVFIYENVFAVLNHDNGKTWETMLNAFEDIGYKFTWKILDAKKYGIPQNRRRLFVIGFKDEKALEDFKFPEEVELKYTMQDFLEDNVEIGGISNVNGKLTITSDKKGEPDEKYFLSDKMTKYVLTPGSKGFTRKLETDRKIAATIVKKAYNCYRAGITNYVTKNGRLRNLTVREIHRLMGFPDDYNIVVSKSQAGRQAGNSIVVDVIMALEREIIKAQKWDTE
jgi:DNA (cytosine-5)-methyltransferase 1